VVGAPRAPPPAGPGAARAPLPRRRPRDHGGPRGARRSSWPRWPHGLRKTACTRPGSPSSRASSPPTSTSTSRPSASCARPSPASRRWASPSWRRRRGSTIASAEARLGDWDQAWESGERALDAARRSKDGGVEGNALNRKALYTINHQQKFAEGIEIYDEAIRRFEASGHLDGLAYALDGSAVAMSTLGPPRGDGGAPPPGPGHPARAGQRPGRGQTLTSLGETYTRFGRYDEAADALDQALVLHTRQGDLFFHGLHPVPPGPGGGVPGPLHRRGALRRAGHRAGRVPPEPPRLPGQSAPSSSPAPRPGGATTCS
jgi:hypothetical protein